MPDLNRGTYLKKDFWDTETWRHRIDSHLSDKLYL